MTGCAQRPTQILDHTHRFELTGLSALAPPGDGWWLIEQRPDRVVFAQTEHGQRARTVWARAIRSAPPIRSYANLHAIAVRMTDQLDPNRFALRTHVVEPIDTPLAMCVRRSMRLDDHVPAANADTPAAEMHLIDTLCRHPREAHLFYAIHVSVRALPGRPLGAIDVLGHAFFDGLRFTATDSASR